MAAKNVRVNSVNPGAVQTNFLFNNGFAKSKEEDEKVIIINIYFHASLV